MAQKVQETPKQSGALQESLQSLAGTFANRAATSMSNRLSGTTQRLSDYAQSGGNGSLIAAATGADKLLSGDSPVKSAMAGGLAGAKEKVKDTLQNVTGAITGKGKGGGGKKLKVTNIVEQVDVGVPIDLAYRQWTQFADFPKFMKKVEQVEQVSDEKLTWKAQIFLSHRSWESTITEQVPNERIVWRSKGDKGYVDGAITFHEIAPNLTRVIVVLEYHPQGLFERTGNLWRAQGRRVRLELKHFQRHVMAHAVLNAEDIQGWPGEIRDGEVISDGSERPEDEDMAGEDATDEDTTDEDAADEDMTDEDATDEDAADEEEGEETEPPPKRRRVSSRSASPTRRRARTERSRA